eukprot:CAMPEP_0202724934 /NCGR_PEP_ID=MMETSP1385-20130828/177810_1 /ASSEMBLY_ACC=CAM_ASM_000861 /TAXON_ID=933848 /ORGANISM="Elphidium margaritaceum" /LENGTH=68 /DNA_ID=CAMNT_0049390743 /DNA_START=21 /DNA_END=223 /DNA_ORIENTATION=-
MVSTVSVVDDTPTPTPTTNNANNNANNNAPTPNISSTPTVTLPNPAYYYNPANNAPLSFLAALPPPGS